MLIHAVESDGLTIKEAAQNLKINYSTAKHIVKVFKKTGEFQSATGSAAVANKRLPDRDVRQLESVTFQDMQPWNNCMYAPSASMNAIGVHNSLTAYVPQIPLNSKTHSFTN